MRIIKNFDKLMTFLLTVYKYSFAKENPYICLVYLSIRRWNALAKKSILSCLNSCSWSTDTHIYKDIILCLFITSFLSPLYSCLHLVISRHITPDSFEDQHWNFQYHPLVVLVKLLSLHNHELKSQWSRQYSACLRIKI